MLNGFTRYWEELTATAVLGTGRRGALPVPPAGALKVVAEGLGDASLEAQLLAVAAGAALYRRAGRLPGDEAVVPVTPSPEDDLPPCGPQATRHLATILSSQRGILPEWLKALAEAGLRAPDEAIPALLDAARSESTLRLAVINAVGRRGVWLAGLNPDWAFAAAGAAVARDAATLAALWQTSSRNERIFMLAALRAEQPAQARALIESTWSSEKADDRAAFVAALLAGLGPDDEVFLEAALDDRGKEVRAHAATLLARLPESRLALRMAARASACVRYTGGFFPKLEVRLPESCDKAMQRDGIELKPPRGMGEKAWWLGELVARTPPAAWCAAWSLQPAAILKVRVAQEWRHILVKAWSTAALAYNDLEWAAALAALAIHGFEPAPMAELLRLLPVARREPLLITLLEVDKHPLSGTHRALVALQAAADPWSPALARAVIGKFRQRFAQVNDEVHTDWRLRAAFEASALTIPPELADEALAALNPELAGHSAWVDTARTVAERLRLRRAMYEALRTGA